MVEYRLHQLQLDDCLANIVDGKNHSHLVDYHRFCNAEILEEKIVRNFKVFDHQTKILKRFF